MRNVGPDRVAAGPSLSKPTPRERRLKMALEFIAANYMNPDLRLGTVARYVGLSGHYLSNTLKTTTGGTFKHHLREIRLREARRLLSTTLLTVKEVAIAVGYGATGSLDREFRRAHGASPSEWRKRSMEPV